MDERSTPERPRRDVLLEARLRALEMVASREPLEDVLALLARTVEELSEPGTSAVIVRADGARAQPPSGCSVPIVGAGGGVLGTFVTRAADGREPSRSERDVVEALVRTAALAIERDHERQRVRAFDAILSNTDDYTVVFDREGRLCFANRAILELWGKTLEEAVGRGLAELGSPPAHVVLYESEVAQVLETKCTVRGIVPFTDASGVRSVYEYVLTPVLGKDGEVDHVAGWSRDVTERTRTAEMMAASEARFRFLSRLGDLTRETSDPEEVMAIVARALGEHLGASRCAYAEVETDSEHITVCHDFAIGCATSVGRYLLSLFGPRASSDQRAGRTLVVENVDLELAPHEGGDAFRSIDVKAIVCCPFIRDGRLAAMMAVHQTTPRAWTPEEIALVEEVVARSWAYIERARSDRAVAGSERRLRAVLEATPECVKIVSEDGALLYMNAAGIAMIEAEDTEGVEGRCAFDLIAAEHLDDWRGRHARVCAGEKTSWEFEIVGMRGTRRWLETHAVPLMLPDGHTAQLAVTREITQRKRSEAEREQLLERERGARAAAEHAGRVKDEFLATLSHELRTPLNAILGWAHVLARKSGLEPDIASALQVIERNARAQTRIIEDLLDMSRIVSGKVRLEFQHAELAPALEAALDSIRPTADAKGVALESFLDAGTGPVAGDPARIQQVFWNLLSNAVKFTPPGGRVQVRIERVASQVEITVADTGEGIPPEFLAHVFDRFRQADSSTTRKQGGLGLGLAIVRQLVELHGGTVRAASEGRGRGSSFVVALPLTLVTRTERLARRRPTPQSTAAAIDWRQRLAGLRVLVVDDEADARAVVRRVLEDCDARVTTAASAEEALACLEVERPDVLVSDVGMPEQDGYALVERMRALGRARGGDTPAVALTAYARAEDRARSLLAGFDVHIAKPIEPLELIAVVARLAERGARARAGP